MRRSVTIAALTGLSAICLPFFGVMATMPAALHPLAAEEQPPAAGAWGESIPDAIRHSALEAETVLGETPCNWRPVLEPIFRPAVANCRSAREATLAIASRIGELTGVYYDMGRRHPCMNALEALAEKKVSCTGQSILLVCALRSVGIPARAVGIATWNHVRGNHTWVEAWFEGQWHMVEFNEKDFNTPWVMEAIGMLAADHPLQRILAVQPGGSHRFPTVWDMAAAPEAEDVTPRYQRLARLWYAQNGVPQDCQKLMADALPRSSHPRTLLLENAEGRELARTPLPTTADDVRRFATLLLPRSGEYFLRVEGTAQRLPVRATESAVQLLQLRSSTEAADRS